MKKAIFIILSVMTVCFTDVQAQVPSNWKLVHTFRGSQFHGNKSINVEVFCIECDLTDNSYQVVNNSFSPNRYSGRYEDVLVYKVYEKGKPVELYFIGKLTKQKYPYAICYHNGVARFIISEIDGTYNTEKTVLQEGITPQLKADFAKYGKDWLLDPLPRDLYGVNSNDIRAGIKELSECPKSYNDYLKTYGVYRLHYYLRPERKISNFNNKGDNRFTTLKDLEHPYYFDDLDKNENYREVFLEIIEDSIRTSLELKYIRLKIIGKIKPDKKGNFFYPADGRDIPEESDIARGIKTYGPENYRTKTYLPDNFLEIMNYYENEVNPIVEQEFNQIWTEEYKAALNERCEKFWAKIKSEREQKQ
jgi:hypothetical protein